MMREIRSAAELRKRIEVLLKRPVPQNIWTHAVEERFVSDVLKEEDDMELQVEWLTGKIRGWIALFGSPAQEKPRFVDTPRRQHKSKIAAALQEARSEALAELARQSEEVKSFRRESLGGRILRFQDVEQWIAEQGQKATYPRALLVRIERYSPLLQSDSWRQADSLHSVEPEAIEGLAPPEYLFYAKPGDEWPYCVPVPRDGPLRALYQLSKTLTRRFHWQEAEATVFLLADCVPWLCTVSAQLSPARPMNIQRGQRFPMLSCLYRIVLTIDPLMGAKEVSQIFAQIQANLLGKKPRTQDEKHLRLAVFAIGHPILNEDAMRRWSELFPEWEYKNLPRFTKEAKEARDGLLHESAIDPLRISQMEARKTMDDERAKAKAKARDLLGGGGETKSVQA